MKTEKLGLGLSARNRRFRATKPISIRASSNKTTAALYNFFPWLVRFRTWPSAIDSSLRQKWPVVSIKPGFHSQRGRPDRLGKFEAQKLRIPFDASEIQEPDGRIGKYLFKLEIVIGSRKSVKHEQGIVSASEREGAFFAHLDEFTTRPLPLRIACPAFLAYVDAQR